MSKDELYKRALALADDAHKAALDPANPLLLDDLSRVIKELVGDRSAYLRDEIDDTLARWDDLCNAIDRVVTSLPSQMTQASANLEHQRSCMRRQIHNLGMARP